MRLHWPRPRCPRRGVTLVEMLVVVALLVLMMTIIVQIFQAATGTITAAKTYQELDASCRMVDITIRQDLAGATARFTPPLDPNNNLGYFEYGENEFADLQNEDTDDYLRFTAQAPQGQPFTGRVWTGPAVVQNTVLGGQLPPVYQPVVVTSQYAEIIYFLRNGNLYRRVLLIAPERQNTITPSANYFPSMFGGNIAVSWQGMNDLSAAPASTGSSLNPIILNTLGSLTNRENRYASPRFCSDFLDNTTSAALPDGLPDDQNFDSVPDLYPTLYPHVIAAGYGTSTTPGLMNDWDPSGLTGYTQPPRVPYKGGALTDYYLLPFPFIFPGMYSRPDPNSVANGLGWIHSIDPDTASSQSFLTSLLTLNHSPLDLGDSLLPPQSGNDCQTWWGFPTWRETLSPSWTDPYWRINSSTPQQATQANGLALFAPNATPQPTSFQLLPMAPGTYGGTFFPGPLVPQPYTEAAISTTSLAAGSLLFYNSPNGLPVWPYAWEDDLILTGVRSFDVKALDQSYGGYVDLGWGDDLRLYGPPAGGTVQTPLFNGTSLTTPPYLSSNPLNTTTGLPLPLQWPPTTGGQLFDLLAQTFAHEGRIPPMPNDGRVNPNLVTQNLGDPSPTVIRLRRVWDSWSTAYSSAPSHGFNPFTNLPRGPPITAAPVYPSYPPPYPAPLHGIQVQIRVVDPRNQRVKVLTIRQDFSDKL